jgi:hypothetical protein
MRRLPIAFVLLLSLVAPAIHSLETTPPIVREQQRTSLLGLESVHLQSLVLTPEPSPEAMRSIVEEALIRAGLRVDSSTRGIVGRPPYLRLAYDIKDETLDGKLVFIYWVSLDLLQDVTWTWVTVQEVPSDPPGQDGGLAITWDSFRTGVASSREEAALEIQQHVRDLSQEPTSDINALQSPHWVGEGIGMDPDGHMRCVEFDSKVTRRPRPPG